MSDRNSNVMPKRKPARRWTADEDQRLIDLITGHGMAGRAAQHAITAAEPVLNTTLYGGVKSAWYLSNLGLPDCRAWLSLSLCVSTPKSGRQHTHPPTTGSGTACD